MVLMVIGERPVDCTLEREDKDGKLENLPIGPTSFQEFDWSNLFKTGLSSAAGINKYW